MGFFDRFRSTRTDSAVRYYDDRTVIRLQDGERLTPADMERLYALGAGSPAKVYKEQPAVRAVVDFRARNFAQLPWHVFELDESGERARDRTSPLARLLDRPGSRLTGYELRRSLISTLDLYDEAFWIVGEDTDSPSGWKIYPIPPTRISQVDGDEFSGDLRVTMRLGDGRSIVVEGPNLVRFAGWSPNGRDVISPIETLKGTIREQVLAAVFRENMWNRGGQVSAVIERGSDAPDWSPTAREKFIQQVKSFESDGENQGRSLLLEDGMKRVAQSFNAREAQWIEAAQLSLETVCRAYHVHPTMLGSTGGVSYANVREFRRMLYGDTLGPLIEYVQARLTAVLGDIVRGDGRFVEFNLEAKLQGSFEEQATVMSQATGVPWMTRNEARKLKNLPPVDGGDELMTPLNFQVGAGRGDAPKADVVLTKAAPKRIKGEADEASSRLARSALAKFFDRQSRSVTAKLGAKSAAWWDENRWNGELAEVLAGVVMSVSAQVGRGVMDSLGFDPDDYDEARTAKFLRAVAESRAGLINAATYRQIEDVLAWDGDDEAERPKVADVFTEAATSRGEQIAGTIVTTVAAFATVEVGKQTGGAQKTWITTSGNPRADHAAMDGETVSVDDVFSNGANWPGDPVLGADGVAGCMCSVEVTF